ncbi:hypothetical protein D3C81_1722570 [compost metagenome]
MDELCWRFKAASGCYAAVPGMAPRERLLAGNWHACAAPFAAPAAVVTMAAAVDWAVAAGPAGSGLC